MTEAKRLFMFKHRVNSFKKFMSNSKDSLLIGKSVSTAFKLSRLIDSGVKTCISYEFFSRAKSLYIANFRNKVYCCSVFYPFDRFKNLNVLTKSCLFTGLFKKFCYFFKLFFKVEKLSQLTLKDKFSYWKELTYGVFSPLFKILSSNSFSFTGKLTKFMRKKRLFIKYMLGSIESKGNSTGIGFVSFGFSDFWEEDTVKVSAVALRHCQPTYHGLGRGATNSFESLNAQVKWSWTSLPVICPNKIHTYKIYNKNYS